MATTKGFRSYWCFLYDGRGNRVVHPLDVINNKQEASRKMHQYKERKGYVRGELQSTWVYPKKQNSVELN